MNSKDSRHLYPLVKNRIPFYNQDMNRAFRDLNTKQAFKEYEYVVILVDGKVINYKEL